MENKNNNLGFGSFLTLLFIGLKLANFINWSWFWVLSPFIIGHSILLSIFLIAYFLNKK